MREILFRGKRVDNDEWVYGMPCATEKSGIYALQTLQGGIFDIIPETVGQYTGLTDKNGKKIFEGDIVKGTFLGFLIPIENFVFDIGWQQNVAGYRANYFENVEVIGNIHDNAELLKGGDENA